MGSDARSAAAVHERSQHTSHTALTRQPTELLRLHKNAPTKLDPSRPVGEAELMLMVTIAVVGALLVVDVRDLLARRK